MTKWGEHSWEIAFVLECLICLTLDTIFKVSKKKKKPNWDFVTWLFKLRLMSLNLISHLLCTLKAHIPLIFNNTQPGQSLSHCWKSDLGTILGWAWWSPRSLPPQLILWFYSQVGFTGLPLQSQGTWAPLVGWAGSCWVLWGSSGRIPRAGNQGRWVSQPEAIPCVHLLWLLCQGDGPLLGPPPTQG